MKKLKLKIPLKSVPVVKIEDETPAVIEQPQRKPVISAVPVYLERLSVPSNDEFDGELVLSASLPPKEHAPKKDSVAYLASLDEPPEGMEKKDWEKRIAAERLYRLFIYSMNNRFGLTINTITVAERTCLKNFYGYFQDLQLVEELMKYIIDNWPGIKARYNLTFEYPVPNLFAYSKFSRQIAIEYHRKKFVTTENPTYINDFGSENDSAGEYKSDW